ncbi:hypothetical protein EW026_g1728 [Hermanssonia centrifuga]|uniref:lytic cellulose monooxygenase (C4-dehydrogenating) n=1 Tax=Hermanssonia centrifuga TaxID=98765 RepID=A0A4S4KQG1_9APHY|nr:hypothetical protein EW026_g1728 [Hermanssonia centrifuga]
MKAFLVALATVAMPLVAAHYTFPDFLVNGTTTGVSRFSTLYTFLLIHKILQDWLFIRETANHYSNAPVTNVNDPEFRCYELDLQNTAGATQTATPTYFNNPPLSASTTLYHPGYLDVYMSKASPAANSPSAATGETWFKVYENPPIFQNGAMTFPSENIQSFTFTIPKSLPSGQYLIRVEHIALHAASTYGGAQFYISCAQVNVVNGGSGTPGPLYEPGILLNIYSFPSGYAGYPSPGPAVWHG